MATIENLKPVRTREEAQRRGRLGGQAKAKKERERKNMQEVLRTLLAMKNEAGGTNIEQVAIALLNKALAGDVRAFEALRDSSFGKPSVTVQAQEFHDVRLVFFGDNPEDTMESGDYDGEQ